MINMETTITECLTAMKEMNAGIIKINIKGVGAVIVAGPEEADEVNATVEALEERWASEES